MRCHCEEATCSEEEAEGLQRPVCSKGAGTSASLGSCSPPPRLLHMGPVWGCRGSGALKARDTLHLQWFTGIYSST